MHARTICILALVWMLAPSAIFADDAPPIPVHIQIDTAKTQGELM